MRAGLRFLVAAAAVALISQRSHSAITNPLMPDSLLFITHDGPTGPDDMHLIRQNYACLGSSGSGPLLMTGARSGSPKVVNLIANSTVINGRLKGQKLAGKPIMSLALSYDAKTILFSCADATGLPKMYYNIFKCNADGGNLTQLTDGPNDDFDACFLPNGRIVFISTRIGGFARCWIDQLYSPNYTLYSMKDDGSDVVQLSYHETNEFRPSVANDGMIVFTRWDYVDRDVLAGEHMWTCYPDGRDPRAPHANYPLPWSTMTGTGFRNGCGDRPFAEMDIRAIPNSPKYVATACGHHDLSYGDLVIIDPTIPDDNKVSQVKRITAVAQGPGTPCIWSCTGTVPANGPQYDDPSWEIYGTPWPLSDTWFLANKKNTIVLIDASAAEQVVYTSSGGRPVDPIPFRPRTTPPNVGTQTWQGERAGLSDHKRATISIMNVYYGDLALPAGAKITALRIMQILPKSTPQVNNPPTGYAAEGLCRQCLGTVPVETDGSAYFEAPVGKEIYFQLLDAKGMAVMSMRSGAFVHPGEQLSCYGCHEDKWKATPAANPAAIKRAPSKLTPEAGAEPNGVTPISYYRLVKPAFDAKCVVCHKQQAKGPTSMAYPDLQDYAFYWPSVSNEDPAARFPPVTITTGDIVSLIHGGSRTTPGSFGAAYSRMGKALLNADHQAALQGGKITQDDIRRVNLWLDANSMLYSAYNETAGQQAGQLVWPDLGYDAANPTGVESAYPLPTGVTRSGLFQNGRLAGADDHPVIHGRMLDLANPCAGSARLRICDAGGRVIADRVIDGLRISVRLPASKGLYLVMVYAPDGHLVKRAQAVAM